MTEGKKTVSKAQQKATNKWINNNYDRINLTVEKGRKDVIKSYADRAGESVNGFISRAISTAMREQESIASLVMSESIAKVEKHIENTGETASEFVNRAIDETITRDLASIRMGVCPIKK